MPFEFWADCEGGLAAGGQGGGSRKNTIVAVGRVMRRGEKSEERVRTRLWVSCEKAEVIEVYRNGVLGYIRKAPKSHTASQGLTPPASDPATLKFRVGSPTSKTDFLFTDSSSTSTLLYNSTTENVQSSKADLRWDVSHGCRYCLLCAFPAEVGENCESIDPLQNKTFHHLPCRSHYIYEEILTPL